MSKGTPGVGVGKAMVGTSVPAGGTLTRVSSAITVWAAEVPIKSKPDGVGVFLPGMLQAVTRNNKTNPDTGRIDSMRFLNVDKISSLSIMN